MLRVKGNYIGSKDLTSKRRMCEDQQDTQKHLFTCAKYGQELSMGTFFDLSITEEDWGNNLEKRLDKTSHLTPSVPPINASVCVGIIIIIIIYIHKYF